MVAIAQIAESFAYGTAKSVLQLCSALGPDDSVTIFYGQRQGTEVDLGSVHHTVKLKPLPGSGKLKHLTNIKFLATELGGKYDVIHGHSSYGGFYAKMVGPKLGISTLYSPRGYSFLREDLSRPARWMFREVEKMTANRCLTVCCGPYEQTLGESLGGKCTRINNGFSVTPPLEVDQLDADVLGVGRICLQKGFDIFCDVARRIPEQSFVWVGDLQKEDRSALENCPSNVTLIPYLPHGELLEKIRHSRFVFLPSRWEGLSRFLIESVCMGKAIVTSDFPGNLDCLAIDPTGSRSFLNGYSCRELDDYESAIRQLRGNDALLDEMQSASYQIANAKFNLDVIVRDWRDLYHSVGMETQSHGQLTIPGQS